VYRPVQVFVEYCRKVELKIATCNICVTRVSRAQKRVFCLRPREGEGLNEQEYVNSIMRKEQYLDRCCHDNMTTLL
jgi:hypothetical protein